MAESPRPQGRSCDEPSRPPSWGQRPSRTSACRRRLPAFAALPLPGAPDAGRYPVPTLLVDEYIVRQVRAVRGMVDEVPDRRGEDEARWKVEIWRDVLQSLLLEFHQRYVPPLVRARGQDVPLDDETEEPAGGIVGVSRATMEGLRQFAEWGVSRWVRGYLYYPWGEPYRNLSALEDALFLPPDTQPLSLHVLGALDRFLAAARRTGTATSRRELIVYFSLAACTRLAI